MKRREFIALLGGAAAAGPGAARAQQGGRVRRIGLLLCTAANDPDGEARFVAFVQGLQKLGWIAGRNVRIDTRWGGGNADDVRKYAAEMVALAPDVILTGGTPLVAALQQVTGTVPIVFAQAIDPIGG